MCGGYRSNVSGLYGWNVYSPRVRGLSVVLSTVTRWLEVFPPCAGVIGGVVHGYPLAGSIPPACGGYRLREAKTPPRQGYSPRVRGLSVTFWQLVKHFCVFPPHAGVNGENGNLHKNVFCIPPVCGGYRPRLSKAK
mgnify:CR=1 FL=1